MYKLFCVILFQCSFSFFAVAQVNNIVSPSTVQSLLHKQNIGRIIFTNRSIAVNDLSEKDFLTNYKLTNKSNLFITVFIANSATNYMHELAPELSSDSLNKIGNYQFTLFVDGKNVYQSNLLPGAPRAAVQDTATIINKPLIDNENDGVYWSQSFWSRFMYYGGDSALSEGNHLLKMEIKTYVDIAGKIVTGNLIASGELKIVVERKPVVNIAAVKLNKIQPYSGFTISDSKFDTALIKKLVGNVSEGVFKKITSLVVVKKGELLLEEYFNGADRNTLHDIRSVGKSFSSTLMGMAIKDGHIKSEQQLLKDFYKLDSFSNYSIQKENITIEQLLTMSSAFNGDDSDPASPGNEENMYPSANWVKFALDLPLDTTKPQKQWYYFTAGVILLGDIINKKVPGGLEKYANDKLFKPLGITHYQWQYTPQHVPNTAGSLQLNSLDLAKYGQLYKNNGNWNDHQLLSPQWVQKTFTHQRIIADRKNEYYGYLFWNKTFVAKGKKYEAFYCAGNGGNSIFIFKDIPLVIVITATAYGTMYAHQQVSTIVADYILPAVEMQ